MLLWRPGRVSGRPPTVVSTEIRCGSGDGLATFKIVTKLRPPLTRGQAGGRLLRAENSRSWSGRGIVGLGFLR